MQVSTATGWMASSARRSRGHKRSRPQRRRSSVSPIPPSSRRSATNRWRTSTAIRFPIFGPTRTASRSYDSFFQGARAPSSPSNVEIIAAQNGETEYKRYGAAGPPYTAQPIGSKRTRRADVGRSRSRVGSLQPADFSKQRQVDQTYANVLLNLEGAEAGKVTQLRARHRRRHCLSARAERRARELDLVSAGLRQSRRSGTRHARHAPPRAALLRLRREQRGRWTTTSRISRSSHPDVAASKLGDGGLFYLKGGFGSNQGLKPATAAPHTYLGDDDHPGESDSQIAEADVAALVNTIARSKYWSQSAIVITWDDPGGFWDHVPPPQWLIVPRR